MWFAVTRKRNTSTQRGAALVEFAVVMPLLVLFFMGMFDLGRALNCYMKLAQVAGEGIRTAGGRGSLEAGSQFENLLKGGTTACDGVPTTTPWNSCPGQYSLHSRINNMLSIYRLSVDNVDVRSGYNDSISGEDRRTVSVSITARYKGILPLFSDLILSTQKTGPYLF